MKKHVKHNREGKDIDVKNTFVYSKIKNFK